MRDLNNRETRNILELKIDKIVADAAKGIILLRALNSLSPRFFSFTNLAVGKRFIDFFLKLLNSLSKNAEMF
jgi:hypothetical protein